MADLEWKDLEAKVRQVRRRQMIQATLHYLPWCLFVALALASLWWIAQPFVLRDMTLDWWQPLLGAVAVAVAAAIALAGFRRPAAVDSAIDLDSAFRLKERVTTAVSLTEEQRRSPAGWALLEDTKQRVEALDVASRFPLRLPRSSALVPIAVAAFAALVSFYDPAALVALEENNDEKAQESETVKVDTTELHRRQARRRLRARQLESEQFEKLTADIDRLLERIDGAKGPEEVNLAIQEVSNLEDRARQRQDELRRLQEIVRKLRTSQELKKLQEGLTKGLQQALSRGDLEEVRKQLRSLAQALKEGKLTEEQKKQLAERLKNIQEKLQKLADLQERRKRIANSNMDPETKRRELAKLDQEARQLQELAQLAEKLGQCQQCMAKGDLSQAAKAMQAAEKVLQEMIQDAEEAAELQAALEDIDRLKQCLGCSSPMQLGEEGEDDPGLEEFESDEYTDPVKSANAGGLRKDRATDTASNEERARSPLDKKGKILFQGYGAFQPKPDRDSIGKTTVELAESLGEVRQEASEALRSQRIPESQRDLVGDFYKYLANPGKKGGKSRNK